jgi:acyl carrier protein
MISGGAVNVEPVYCAIAAEALAQKQVVIVDDDAPDAKHLVSVGNTWLDTKMAIVNPETSQETFTECKPDQVGEIWISGSSVAIGYWQNPEATKATFQAQLSDRPEHWLRTGDLGFVRGGELFITGRLKDLLILWGRNHYPQDIELTVQNSHPSLRIDAGAAFSIEVNHQITIQESLVIVQEVERSALRNLDVDAIMSAIRQAVSEQHEISVFAIALIKPASISKTSSGKIQRHACREQFLAGSLAIVAQWTNPNLEDTESSLPSSSGASSTNTLTEDAILEWLLGRIAQALNIDPDDINVDVSLFSYGIDSSVLLNLTADLSDWSGHQLKPTLFWEYPTIMGLTAYLLRLSEN